MTTGSAELIEAGRYSPSCRASDGDVAERMEGVEDDIARGRDGWDNRGVDDDVTCQPPIELHPTPC